MPHDPEEASAPRSEVVLVDAPSMVWFDTPSAPDAGVHFRTCIRTHYFVRQGFP
jgi:hypothetical protein